MFTIIPGVFLAIGAHQVWSQDRTIRAAQPVKVRVLSTGLDRHHGKTTTYAPVVQYTYEVNGTQYTSQRVPIAEKSTTLARGSSATSSNTPYDGWHDQPIHRRRFCFGGTASCLISLSCFPCCY
jgi:hypothetical protein